ARRLGLGPDAARAVGAANGRNPLPIVLPCHRVLGANGSLTGFGGGLHVKRALLEHEGALLPVGLLRATLLREMTSSEVTPERSDFIRDVVAADVREGRV